jgi:hypothetical protein
MEPEELPEEDRSCGEGSRLPDDADLHPDQRLRSSLGQQLTLHEIRRQRAEGEDSNIIVFAEDRYAIFHIEELLILLGGVPKVLLRADPRELRRRYGLAPAA